MDAFILDGDQLRELDKCPLSMPLDQPRAQPSTPNTGSLEWDLKGYESHDFQIRLSAFHQSLVLNTLYDSLGRYTAHFEGLLEWVQEELVYQLRIKHDFRALDTEYKEERKRLSALEGKRRKEKEEYEKTKAHLLGEAEAIGRAIAEGVKKASRKSKGKKRERSDSSIGVVLLEDARVLLDALEAEEPHVDTISAQYDEELCDTSLMDVDIDEILDIPDEEAGEKDVSVVSTTA